MSHIILPLDSFCPQYYFAPPLPGNRLMIYTIYPCSISFCPLNSFCPHIILPLYHFAPWKLFNDLYFLPISCIIFPLWFIFPPGFILPPGNCLMIYTFYPCPISFCPLDSFYPVSFCPSEIVKWFTLFTHVPYHFTPYHFAPWREIA